MTLRELKQLDWLKFDRNAVDVLVLFDARLIVYWLDALNFDYNDNADYDELVNLLKQSLKDNNIDWKLVQYGNLTYLDTVASSQDGFEFDDDTVVEFNLTSYKRPTIILSARS